MIAREMLGLIFEQPETGLPAMWGSAAWAQSQLTPGVSALAAPRSSVDHRHRELDVQPNCATRGNAG
jgi:hypothetical protein